MKSAHLLLILIFHFISTNHSYSHYIYSINDYFKNPIFLESDSSASDQININNDELEIIKELEVREKIIQALRAHPKLNRCDRTFLLWLSTIIKNTLSENDIINDWRSVAAKHGYLESNLHHTQIKILHLTDNEIKHIYQEAKENILKFESELTQELLVSILKNHQWHDKHQMAGIPLRNTSIIKSRKINVKILTDYISLIQTLHNENQIIPIGERLKSIKAFHINDFYGSKGSLITHDIFDHFWFTTSLETKGVFNRYKELWSDLGNPQLYDIFSREGELFASIAFDFRSFQRNSSYHCTLVSLENIRTILEHSIQNKTATENQKKALNLITTSDKNSIFLQGLAYIVNGMSIELLELNRKAGFIKILDNQCKPKGYFHFFEPEHIAFIIEATHFLFSNYDRHVEILINISLLIEQYLTKAATLDILPELIIGLEDIETLDQLKIHNLSQEKINWIKNNVGFETSRYQID